MFRQPSIQRFPTWSHRTKQNLPTQKANSNLDTVLITYLGICNLGMNLPKRRLKQCLISKGWTHADLAKATRYAVQTIRNVSSGGSTSERARGRIEAALGVRIWDRPAAVAQPVQPGSGDTAEPVQPTGKACTAQAPQPSRATSA